MSFLDGSSASKRNVPDALSRRIAAELGAGPTSTGGPEITIDLGRMISLLRSNLRPIIIITIAALLASSAFLHIVTYRYTVSMQVTPVPNQAPGGGTGGSAALLAGIAGLAGGNLPTGLNQTQLTLYLEELKSPDVAADLLNQPEISHVVFENAWDEKRHAWSDRSKLRPVKNAIKAIIGFPVIPWFPPSAQDMMKFLTQSIVISYKPTSPVITITIKHKDRVFAQKLLIALHSAADRRLRQRMLDRSEQYINYVTRELQTVITNDQRDALITTLAEQEKFKMMAGANVAYSVDVFSPPSASDKPTTPDPKMVMLIGLILGMIAGSGYVIIRHRHR